MGIFVKIFAVVLAVAFLVLIFIRMERRLERVQDIRWRLLGRSFLYAFMFTPTVYHHAPNTIVAPLHLSTICGNLFYGYDYTVDMFFFGVVVSLLFGWVVMTLFFLFRGLEAQRATHVTH